MDDDDSLVLPVTSDTCDLLERYSRHDKYGNQDYIYINRKELRLFSSAGETLFVPAINRAVAK